MRRFRQVQGFVAGQQLLNLTSNVNGHSNYTEFEMAVHVKKDSDIKDIKEIKEVVAQRAAITVICPNGQHQKDQGQEISVVVHRHLDAYIRVCRKGMPLLWSSTVL